MLCQKNGISMNKMTELCGISHGSVNAWKNGTVPKSDTLRKIADYFKVTTDFLLTGEEAKAVVTYDPDREIFECIEMLKDSEVRRMLMKLKRGTVRDRKKVFEMVDVLIKGDIEVG